ncbi:MAG: substrate-binding domain-containing protein [Opitutaceae bacterium]|jgi:iron(III) transport system substrate-binding protein|nr:substrate-binding domain-containing protein [Opitutaceae bacterium]
MKNAGACPGLALLFASGLVFFLAGCARPSARLVVYSAGPRPLAERICRGYSDATGMPVVLFSATTGQILSRLEAERFHPRADVVILASRVAAEALKQGNRLRPVTLPPGEQPGHPDWHDPGGYFYGMAAAVIGVALRADHPPPPAGGWDWMDFLQGRHFSAGSGVGIGGGGEGKTVRISLPSPTRSGASGDFVMAWLLARGEAGWSDFRQARRRHGLEIAGANAQALTGLLTGANQAVIGAADYVVLREVERGEPVRIYYPKSGGVYVTRPVAVLAGARQPDAAAAFVRYCLGEAAQREVARVHLLPARTGIPPGPLRLAAGEARVFPFDAAAALALQSVAMRRFQYEIERAVFIDP